MKPARYCGIPLKFATAFVAVLLMAVTGGAAAASAQGRMSDSDVESLMKNLTAPSLKTSQEKDAKALVERFQKQTERLLSEFQNKQKADQSLPAVRSSAEQIDKLLTTTAMGGETSTACAKIKTELGTISGQFATATPR